MDSNNRMSRVMSTYTKDLPLRYLDAENIEQSFDQIKKWLDQTTLNRNTKDNILKEAIGLEEGDQAGLFNVATNMLEEVGRDLVDNFQVSQKTQTHLHVYLQKLMKICVSILLMGSQVTMLESWYGD